MMDCTPHFQRTRAWGRTGLRLGWALAFAPRLIAQTAPDGGVDKSHHDLFHPTPPEFMRQLSTDRPDQTESPRTVDAGHFQLEMDVFNASFDHDTSSGADLKAQTQTAGGLNLKAGLYNNVDIQFVFDVWTKSRVEDRVANAVTETEGPGDLQTRLKVNLWGNDDGRTALAVMPFVKWPLSESAVRNGEAEGGLIIPVAADLGRGWGLGAMVEFDFVSDGNGGRDTEYFNTITFGRDLAGRLAGYLEFAALVAPESNPDWQGQLGVGFTFALNQDTQFDLGCNFGVTRTAPDFNPFIGITFRH